MRYVTTISDGQGGPVPSALFRLFLLVGAMLLPGLALAQTGTLSGTITDGESGESLPGANVFVVELGSGSATDVDGLYTITDIGVGTYTIRVSFSGYKSVEQAYTVSAGQNTLDVALAPDYAGLEEVVVTGIASATSKARAEVAVSRVDATKLQEQNAYQDVSQLLSGKVAGVSVQPSSGNVGGGIRFVMRSSTGLNGSGQPIIYIDGVRIDNDEIGGPGAIATNGFGVGGQGVSMLANLNPEDIESIDILKGPAGAALYGTSGSNGVVLIKTKRGQLGAAGVAPFSLNYKGVLGANQQADEYTRANAGTPDVANAFFRDGTISQHSLSAFGGSNIVRYFASYDTRSEEGHLRNNKQDRQSFRANFEAFPSQKLTLRANTNYTLNDISRPQNDNNVLGYLGNTLLATTPFIFTDSTAIEALSDINRITRFIGSVEAEYEVIPQLRLRASVGYDGTELRNDNTRPSDQSYSGTDNGRRSIFERRNEQYTYDLNARYGYDLTSTLRATSIVGGQAFDRTRRTFFIRKEDFQTELITNVGAGADFFAGDEDFLQEREAGVYGQQEFTFQDRFFLTLGLRRDFATAIGTQASDIWYPKASLAVRLDQFGGLPQPITFLKLRAAYGETGQLPSLLDASDLRWSAEASGVGAGAVIDFIGNTEIEPERVRELEIGLETEFFNNVGFDFTYYWQWAEDSIIDFVAAPSTGLSALTNADFNGIPFNVGGSRGWGLETSLSAAPIQSRSFGLDFTAIWNYQKNEVDDLGGAQPIFGPFDTNVIAVGMPRDAFYVWSTRATFNDDGSYAGPEFTSTDEDGDGQVDRAFFGIPYPEHNGSLSVNVRFLKNFNLNMLADWQLGNSVYNSTARFQAIFGGHFDRNVALVQIGQNEPCDFNFCDDDGGILPEFQDVNLQALEVGSPEYRAAAETVAGTTTTFQGTPTRGNFVEEADFFKLREISLRYDFTDLLRKTRANSYVRSLSFTLSARNLYTTTDYSGADPEVNFRGARDQARAQDFLTLPSPRVIYGTISIGL